MVWAVETYTRKFWERVAKTETCWLWTGSKNPEGYGRLRWLGRDAMAHRVAYEMEFGSIPEGLVIDHVEARGCQNKNCVRPDHLEAVTNRENVLRGYGPSALSARRDSCKRGHPYTLRNGKRVCRPCDSAKSLRYQQRKKAQRRASSNQDGTD